MKKDFRRIDDFIDRLQKEQNKYGKLTIAIDFDDTLCHYDNENILPTIDRQENSDICNLIRAIGDRATIILWTCRSAERLDEALAWLKLHNIAIDAIGENPFIDYGGRKIHANIFLDDRAGLDQAYEALKFIYNIKED